MDVQKYIKSWLLDILNFKRLKRGSKLIFSTLRLKCLKWWMPFTCIHIGFIACQQNSSARNKHWEINHINHIWQKPSAVCLFSLTVLYFLHFGLFWSQLQSVKSQICCPIVDPWIVLATANLVKLVSEARIQGRQHQTRITIHKFWLRGATYQSPFSVKLLSWRNVVN